MKISNKVKGFIETIIYFGIFTILITLIILYVNKTHQTTSPVEEYQIDSITLTNKKLILEVNNLDSIKNVETIEVKSLDNDSTLKLFYQLIRE